MKAISIKQPWLWAITDLDKRIENRTWKPFSSNIGQRICLHASKADDKESGVVSVRYIALVEIPNDLPRGAIVATATLTGYISDTGFSPPFEHLKEDKWYFGPYGWILTDVRKLPEPIPCRGTLGLWNVPQDIRKKVTESRWRNVE